MSLHDQIGRAHRALTPTRKPTASPEARAAAAVEVNALIARRKWTVEPEAPALATLIETVAALRSLGQDNLVSIPRRLRRSRRHVRPTGGPGRLRADPRPTRRIRRHRHHPGRNPDLVAPPDGPGIHLRRTLALEQGGELLHLVRRFSQEHVPRVRHPVDQIQGVEVTIPHCSPSVATPASDRRNRIAKLEILLLARNHLMHNYTLRQPNSGRHRITPRGPRRTPDSFVHVVRTHCTTTVIGCHRPTRRGPCPRSASSGPGRPR